MKCTRCTSGFPRNRRADCFSSVQCRPVAVKVSGGRSTDQLNLIKSDAKQMMFKILKKQHHKEPTYCATKKVLQKCSNSIHICLDLVLKNCHPSAQTCTSPSWWICIYLHHLPRSSCSSARRKSKEHHFNIQITSFENRFVTFKCKFRCFHNLRTFSGK